MKELRELLHELGCDTDNITDEEIKKELTKLIEQYNRNQLKSQLNA